jgi:four helix bundle protein
MAVRRPQDLIAWQLADAFKVEVFRLMHESHRGQADLRFKFQLLDAASSVPSNISEGFLRCSPGDFARFLDYAVGSLGETEQRLRDGIQLGYFTADDCQPAFKLARRCLTASVRLKQSQLRYLRNRPGAKPRSRAGNGA